MNLKQIIVSATAAALFAAPIAAGAQGAANPSESDQKVYAVLNFDAVNHYGYTWWGGYQPLLIGDCSEELVTEMVQGGFRLVERKRLEDILKEQNLQKDGQVAPETAVKIGQLTGAQYLVEGTITEWGMSDKGFSTGGVFGRLPNVGVKTVTGRCVIDFRVVNAQTGEIEVAGKSEGNERRTNISLDDGWYRSINLQNHEWWGSQIGKATRKAIHGIVTQMIGLKPDELTIVDMAGQDDIIVEVDDSIKLKKGDKFDLFRVTHVTRRGGKVIFKQTEPVGQAEVAEVQEGGVLMHITDRVGGGQIDKTCFAKRKK